MAVGDPMCPNGDDQFVEWAVDPRDGTALSAVAGYTRIPRVNNFEVDDTEDNEKRAHSDSSGAKEAGCGTSDFTVTFTAQFQEGTPPAFRRGAYIVLKVTLNTGEVAYHPTKITGFRYAVDYDATSNIAYDVTATGNGVIEYA